MTSEVSWAHLPLRPYEPDDEYLVPYLRVVAPTGDVCVTFRDGTRAWYLDGKLHRTDGPAVETPRGFREWYRNGVRHRDDGPAMEWPDGRRQWIVNGETTRFEAAP